MALHLSEKGWGWVGWHRVGGESWRGHFARVCSHVASIEMSEHANSFSPVLCVCAAPTL